MKVQVNVTTLTGDTVTLNLTASPEDTVFMVKERVALAEPNPFQNQVLSLGGKILKDDSKLSDCGVEDGGLLDFQAQATEEAFAKQLGDMLASKGWVPIEELGLLYTLKHGVTAGSALQACGKHDLLQTFLEKLGKHFVVKDGQVKLANNPSTEAAAQQCVAQPLEQIPENAAVQKLEVAVSVTVRLPAGVLRCGAVDLRVGGADTVGSVKQRACALEQVPFADQELLLDGKVLADDLSLADCGVADASRLDLVAYGSEDAFAGQLASILEATGPSSRMDLDNMYCCRHGVSASDALRMLGWAEKLQVFLQRHPLFAVASGRVALAAPHAAPGAGPGPAARGSAENQRLLDLHAELNDSEFSAKVSRSLHQLTSALSDGTFLNVRKALPGGAAARGTAIPGAAGAEVVLFVGGLPHDRQDGWLRSLAASAAGALGEQLPDGLAAAGVVSAAAAAAGGALRLGTAEGGPLGEVAVFFAPEYGSYTETVDALRIQDPATRSIAAAALVAQKVRFVEKQPEGAKATMRLMKWWRQQRQWTSDMARPSDDLLELVVAHTVAQTAPRDLSTAVSSVLSVLARFDELKVTWPLALRCYREDDVLKPLLTQRPLLLDPTNPLVNLADPQLFQPGELMAHARAGSFFL